MPFSCQPEEINPAINAIEIADEITSVENELKHLWTEFVQLGINLGLVDANDSPEEIRAALDAWREELNDGDQTRRSDTVEIDGAWADLYAEPQSVRYGSDGVITVTSNNGEIFTDTF